MTKYPSQLLDKEHTYYSVGFNYETCPLNLREALAIGEQEIEFALRSLQDSKGVIESVILSTCNRTEIFSYATNGEELVQWLASYRDLKIERILPALYIHVGDVMVQHAFRVAAGLDSMVLGETQILGQLKKSVRKADELGALGPRLRQLFDTSFSVAKTIRTETNVGAHSVSLAAASVKVSERIFGVLSDTKVLFVGAGEMNRICAEYFISFGVKNISISNRTVSRGRALAKTLKGEFFSLGDITQKLNEYDIVVTCTGSPIPIVGKRAIEKAIEARRRKPMLLIDLAVPRDIELEASDLEDVFLYTIDDLGVIVKDGMRNREEAARDAEKLIENGLTQFNSQLEHEKITPVIKKFRQRGESIMQAELEKALSLISKGQSPEKVVATLSRAITNKFMDEPSRVLNREIGEKKLSLSDALEKLYGLDKNN
jgi:glutamyl-tRNA reductase